MTGKNPAFQFYPSDWVADTVHLSAAARGIWISVICAMWNTPVRGVYTASVEELARACGSTTDEILTVLDQFERHNTCDLKRECNGIVTLRCRRMVRDEKARCSTRERVKRCRSNGDVTPMKRESNPASSSSSSSSGTKVPSPKPPVGAGWRWEFFTAIQRIEQFKSVTYELILDVIRNNTDAKLETRWLEVVRDLEQRKGHIHSPKSVLQGAINGMIPRSGGRQPVTGSGSDDVPRPTFDPKEFRRQGAIIAGEIEP